MSGELLRGEVSSILPAPNCIISRTLACAYLGRPINEPGKTFCMHKRLRMSPRIQDDECDTHADFSVSPLVVKEPIKPKEIKISP